MLLTAGLLQSCFSPVTQDVSISTVRHGRELTAMLSMQPMENIVQTKSQFAGSDNAVLNWTLFIFDSEGTRVGTYYKDLTSPEAGDGKIKVKVKIDETYYYYAIANVGDLTGSAPATKAACNDLVVTLSAGNSSIAANMDALPAAGTAERCFTRTEYESNRNGLAIEIPLTRLVGRYDIAINKAGDGGSIPGLHDWDFTVSALELKGVNTVKPFKDNSTGSNNETINDKATSSDITSINAGNAISVYPLENVVNLPSGTTVSSLWEKVPSTVGSSLFPSYVEIRGVATLQDGSGLQKDVTYHFYLGQNNTDDFKVIRNQTHQLVLYLTDESIWNDEPGRWKIEVGPFDDNRVLRFTRNLTEPTSASSPVRVRAGQSLNEAITRKVGDQASNFKYNVTFDSGLSGKMTVLDGDGHGQSSLSEIDFSSLQLVSAENVDAEGYVRIFSVATPDPGNNLLNGHIKEDKLYVQIYNAFLQVLPDDPITWDWNEHTQKDVTVTSTIPWTATVPEGWSLTYATGGAISGEQAAGSNIALKILPPTADYTGIEADATATLSFAATGTDGDAVTLIRRYKPQVLSGGNTSAALDWAWNESGSNVAKTLTISSNEDWVIVWPEGDHSHWSVSPASGAKTATTITVYPEENNTGTDPIIGTFYVVPVRGGVNVDAGKLTVTITHNPNQRWLTGIRFGLWPNATTEKFHSDTTVTYRASGHEQIWPHVYADFSDGSVEDVSSHLDAAITYDTSLLGLTGQGWYYGLRACQATLGASYTSDGVTKTAVANITVLHGSLYNFKIEPTNVSLLSGGATQTFTPYKLYQGDDQWYELTAEEKQSIEWTACGSDYGYDYVDYDTFTRDGCTITTINKRGLRYLKAKWSSMFSHADVEVYSNLVSLEYRPPVVNLSAVTGHAYVVNQFTAYFYYTPIACQLIATYHDGSEDDITASLFPTSKVGEFTESKYAYSYHYLNPNDNKTYLFLSKYMWDSQILVGAAKEGFSDSNVADIYDDNNPAGEHRLYEGAAIDASKQLAFHNSSFTHHGVTKTATLLATVDAAPYITVSPESLSWEWYEGGSSAVKQVTVSTNVTDWEIQLSGTDASKFYCDYNLSNSNIIDIYPINPNDGAAISGVTLTVRSTNSSQSSLTKTVSLSQGKKPTLSVSPTSANFPWDWTSGAETITVTSDISWTAALDANGSANFTISSASGSGNGSITVSPKGQNTDETNAKTGKIIFTGVGDHNTGITCEVNLNQAKKSQFSIDPTSHNWEWGGATFQFTVIDNQGLDWTTEVVGTDASSFTASKSGDKVNVTVGQNSSPYSKTATLRIKVGTEVKATASLSQDPHPYLAISALDGTTWAYNETGNKRFQVNTVNLSGWTPSIDNTSDFNMSVSGDIVTISPKGTNSGTSVKNVRLTVTSDNYSVDGESDYIDLAQNPDAPAESVSITGGPLWFYADDGGYTRSVNVVVDAGVAWTASLSSSDFSIVSGYESGTGPGQLRIYCEDDNNSGSNNYATLYVYVHGNSANTSVNQYYRVDRIDIDVDTDPITIKVDEYSQATATWQPEVSYDSGNSFEDNGPATTLPASSVTWSVYSGDESYISINSDGLIKGLAVHNYCWVKAEYGGEYGLGYVNVTAAAATFVRYEYGNPSVSASASPNPIAASGTSSQISYSVSCDRWEYWSDDSYRNKTTINDASSYVNASYTKKSGSNSFSVNSSGTVSVPANTGGSATFTVTCSIKSDYTVKSGENSSGADDVTISQNDPSPTFVRYEYGNPSVSASASPNPIAHDGTSSQISYSVSCDRWEYWSDNSYRDKTVISDAKDYVNVSYARTSGSTAFSVDNSGVISVSANTSTSSRSATFRVTCTIKSTYTVKSGEDSSGHKDIGVEQSGKPESVTTYQYQVRTTLSSSSVVKGSSVTASAALYRKTFVDGTATTDWVYQSDVTSSGFKQQSSSDGGSVSISGSSVTGSTPGSVTVRSLYTADEYSDASLTITAPEPVITYKYKLVTSSEKSTIYYGSDPATAGYFEETTSLSATILQMEVVDGVPSGVWGASSKTPASSYTGTASGSTHFTISGSTLTAKSVGSVTVRNDYSGTIDEYEDASITIANYYVTKIEFDSNSYTLTYDNDYRSSFTVTASYSNGATKDVTSICSYDAVSGFVITPSQSRVEATATASNASFVARWIGLSASSSLTSVNTWILSQLYSSYTGGNAMWTSTISYSFEALFMRAILPEEEYRTSVAPSDITVTCRKANGTSASSYFTVSKTSSSVNITGKATATNGTYYITFTYTDPNHSGLTASYVMRYDKSGSNTNISVEE